MRRLPSSIGWLFVFALVLPPALADAQLRSDTESVMTPPLAFGAPDSPFAVELNPAAIPTLAGWGISYIHAGGPSTAPQARDRGDSVYAAVPLPLGFGLGFGVERVKGLRDIDGVGRFSFAFAYGNEHVGGGLAVRHLEGGILDGATTVDLSLLLRPSSRFAISLLAQNVLGETGLVGLNGQQLPTTMLGALTYRPWGYDYLTLEAFTAVNSDWDVGVGGLASVWVPHAGRLSARVTANDLSGTRDVRVIAGADLQWTRIGAFGGVVVGDGYDDGIGWYAGGTIGARSFTGLPRPRTVLDLAVRGSVGERRILRVVAKLDQVANDPRVDGVLLRLRDTEIGLAYAQELRQAIETVRAAGKQVLCHLESATGAEIYACTAADQTLLDPAGHVRLLGPSMDVLFYGELLEHVGVHADFVRIGEFKSAPEHFMRSSMSEPDRLQRDAYLDDVYARMLGDLARSTHITVAEAEALVDDGPYAAVQAVHTPLVQGTADEAELDEPLAAVIDGPVRLRKSLRPYGPGAWSQGRHVGVVIVDGTMVDGENVDIPIIGIHQSGGRTVVQAIERMAADRSVSAIVLRVDSGGGSALASDQIWRALRRAREHKPVIASMGALAASGGYYIASACDEIFTDPSTLTGSIGIFFGKVDIEGLLDMAGVTAEQLARGAHAGASSLYRPFTDEEREALREQIELGYRMFLARVAEGRGMSSEAVDAVGRGRIWSGDAAIREGLADRRGGFIAALARARELGRVPPQAEIEYVPSRPSSLLDYVLQEASPSGRAGVAERRGRGSEEAGEAGAPRLPIPARLREALDLAVALDRIDVGTGLALLPVAAHAP
jgi:protease-4